MKKGLFVALALCLCTACSPQKPPKQTICKGCDDHNYESHDVYYQGVSPWLGEDKKNEEIEYSIQFRIEYEDGKIVHITDRVLDFPGDDMFDMIFDYQKLHDCSSYGIVGYTSEYKLKNDDKSVDVFPRFKIVINDTVVVDVNDVIEIK